MSEAERSLENAKGSLEVLETLREEFSEWLGEANDESQKEMLENVLGHVEALSREYEKRREEAAQRLVRP
jgi:hypothetical protein